LGVQFRPVQCRDVRRARQIAGRPNLVYVAGDVQRARRRQSLGLCARQNRRNTVQCLVAVRFVELFRSRCGVFAGGRFQHCRDFLARFGNSVDIIFGKVFQLFAGLFQLSFIGADFVQALRADAPAVSIVQVRAKLVHAGEVSIAAFVIIAINTQRCAE